ncbi:MAG TPA: hypothetical protein VIL20_04105 [Sandaracinaceae bacterium]
MRYGHVALACALAGCAPTTDLSNVDETRAWANTASALGVYANLYDPIASADGRSPFADPECPVVADDGAVHTITGGCTDAMGRTWRGSATVTRDGRVLEVVLSDFGSEDGSERRTLDGTVSITDESATRRVFVANYTLTGNATTTTYDYEGTVEGSYDGPTTWNGSGTVTRSGEAPSGTVAATTRDQRRDSEVCSNQSLSGTTRIEAGGRVAVVEYDGAADCDDDADARWSLDGVDQGEIAGIACGAGPGSSSAGVALALAAAGLALARRRLRRFDTARRSPLRSPSCGS